MINLHSTQKLYGLTKSKLSEKKSERSELNKRERDFMNSFGGKISARVKDLVDKCGVTLSYAYAIGNSLEKKGFVKKEKFAKVAHYINTRDFNEDEVKKEIRRLDLPINKSEPASEQALDDVMKAIKSGDPFSGVSMHQIISKTGYSKGFISSVIRDLKDRGLISSRQIKAGQPAFYKALA